MRYSKVNNNFVMSNENFVVYSTDIFYFRINSTLVNWSFDKNIFWYHVLSFYMTKK